MADAPSTPAAGAVPASPKLLLPPMTVSPGVTRLDRVLDLVTDHEAQFRDHELRVVDLSARVAAVERAVGGTEARSVALADGTPYGAYPDGEHPNDETPPDLRSEMATTKASVADLRLEFAEALREVRSEMRSLVDDAKAQKAGFKRVLRDVLDRVAGQLDAVRARQGTAVTDAGRSASDARKTSAGGESFASAAELAALAERVSLAETVAERAGAAALSPSRDVIKTRRLSETERRVDALAEELRRLRDDGDDLRARVARASSSFSVLTEDELPARESRGSLLEHSVADDAVAEQLRALARRFDEQREETEALKRVVLETRGLRNDVVSRSASGKAPSRSPQRSPMMRSPMMRSPQRSPQRSPMMRSPSHSTSFRSPRVSSDARRRDADDGLIRLGFGAYAGASLTARSDTKRTTNALPRNAGFVAEASARLRKTKARGSASRTEDPDAASAAFREYLARLPEAVAEAAKEKNLPRLSR